MRQRADNNAAKVDELINWIYSIKSQSIDKELSEVLDIYLKHLSGFYNQDLARMDDQIRNVKRGIYEEIGNYNLRVQQRNSRYNRE